MALPNIRFESVSIVAWNLLLGTIVLVLGIAYVFQVSVATQHGYTMRDLDGAVAELELEQELATVRIAEAISLQTVTERMEMLGFVEGNEVVYLTGVDSFARR